MKVNAKIATEREFSEFHTDSIIHGARTTYLTNLAPAFWLGRMVEWMKKFRCCLGVALVGLLAGCAPSSHDATVPAAMPVVSRIQARPEYVNPGAVVVLDIYFADTPGDLNGGTLVVADSQGNSYRKRLSHSEIVAEFLHASIALSPLVSSGNLLLQVMLFDSRGNPSNTEYVAVNVL